MWISLLTRLGDGKGAVRVFSGRSIDCFMGVVETLCIARRVALVNRSVASDIDTGFAVFLCLSCAFVVSGVSCFFNIEGSVRAASSFILKILPSVFSYSRSTCSEEAL